MVGSNKMGSREAQAKPKNCPKLDELNNQTK